MASALLAIGVIYFIAQLLAVTYPRTRVPDVLVLVLLGMLVGPVLGWVSPADFGHAGPILTTIALSVILFESGTSMSLRTIIAGAGEVVAITLITALITGVTVTVAAALWGGLPWLSAAILGAIVSGTSSAVVIPMARAFGLGNTASTVLALESVLTDVLCIVAAFGLMEAALASGGVNFGRLLGSVVASFAFAAALGAVSGFLWLFTWSRVRSIPNTLFTTLAFGFLLYGVVDFLGFSGPIAVLAFGTALANYRWLERWPAFRQREVKSITAQEQDFYQEAVFLLKTFFFIFLGISMQLRAEMAMALLVGGALVVIYLSRVAVIRLTAGPNWSKIDRRVAAFMVPKGLAAAVLAGVPLQLDIEGGEVIRDLTYAFVLGSIVLTAVLGALIHWRPLKSGYDRLLGDGQSEIVQSAETKPEEPRRAA